jgi:peroxiredoxin
MSEIKLQGFGPHNNQERMAPVFKLPASQGGNVALWDYKQRQPVVLYLLPEPDPTLLGRLQSEYATYKAQGAQLLVITPYPVEQMATIAEKLHLSYPLLSDAEGRTYKRYLNLIEADLQKELPAAVFITDRFGATNRYASASETSELPPQTEILEHLDWLGNLCNP